MALPSYKDIVELIKKGATVEAQEQIMALREGALALQEENIGLKKRLQELETELAEKASLTFERGVYWLRRENGSEGPYCQRCKDVDSKMVRLHQSQVLDHGNWVAGARCRQCKSSYIGQLF